MTALGTATLTASPLEADIGQGVRFVITVTDATGTAVAPATCSLTITLPDASTVPVAIGGLVNDTVGVYHYDWLTSQSGQHLATVVTTVPNAAADAEFQVRQPLPGMPNLVSFKNFLNLTNNTGLGGDDELKFFLDSAVGLVDYEVDKLLPTTRTEQHHGGGPTIILDYTPTSVTSVTELVGSIQWTITEQPLSAMPSTWNAYGFTRYGATLTRRVNGFASAWAGGIYNILVTYQAGLASVPVHAENALYELATHLFKSQQGSQGQRGQEDWSPPQAYAMANRVREMLQPIRKQPGIA